MGYFAKINENNKVEEVVVISNHFLAEPETKFPETEKYGQSFIADVLKLDGKWLQTSYNHNFRKQYASIGYEYDEINDVFICPSPYNSWTLDENFDWQPPIPKPEEKQDVSFFWNENNQKWEEVPDFL